MQHHVGELADAYALGILELGERARVDAHLATCVHCTRAVGEAEELLCRIVTATTLLVDPPASLGTRIAASARRAARASSRAAWAAWGAAAAVLSFSLGLNADLIHQTSKMASAASRNDAVLATLARSHFKHRTLDRFASGAPVAKVVYAPDKSWFYVIVDAPECRLHVVAGTSRTSHDFGIPDSGPKTSTLFEATGERPQMVSLIDGAGRLVARAELE